MGVASQSKVEVVITGEGVEVVRLYGSEWTDSEAALALFARISPFLRQLHAFLKPTNDTEPN